MAILLLDGFDHYVAAQASMKGWSTGFPVAMGAGRFGEGQSANWIPSATDTWQRRRLKQDSAPTVYVGFGWKYSVDLDPNVGLFCLLDQSTVQVSVEWDGVAKKFNAYSGDTVGGSLLGTSTAVDLNVDTWAFLEVKVYFHGSLGTVEIKHNSLTVLTLTNLNTVPSGRPLTTDLRMGAGGLGHGSGATVSYDDLRVVDSTGTPNNTWLGDCRVRTLYPASDGAFSDMDPTPTGTTNYDKVNETLANESNYVASNVVGAKDTYNFADLPTDFVVKGVQSTMIVRKDDAFDRNVGLYVKNATQNTTIGDVPLSPSWSAVLTVMDQDPLTAAPWTPEKVNDSEFGPTVTA